MDAFLRDTQHLAADEIGGYFLVLGAMWTRESCDLPNDPGRLARIARVSVRLWNVRIGPALMPFFTAIDGAIISKRLRIEAAFVEKHCQDQSDRRSGDNKESGAYAKSQGDNNVNDLKAEKSRKSLKNNNVASTVDATGDEPRRHPTQQPNNPTIKEDLTTTAPLTAREETSSSDKDFDDLYGSLLSAVGFSGGAKVPVYWRKSQAQPFLEMWLSKLTPAQIIAVAVKAHQLMPITPNGPKALSKAMRDAWDVAAQPAPDPDEMPKYFAKLINGDGFLPANMISLRMQRDLVARGFVTPEQMKARGVR